jgi:peptidoglycan hydrolase-like protein with peptidoglycan-binding domain
VEDQLHFNGILLLLGVLMTIASDIILVATSEIGNREISADNQTKYNSWYGASGSWCAMFVSYVFYHSGMPLPIQSSRGFAYCPTGVNWFKNDPSWKWVQKGEQPEIGDIVFYDWHPGVTVAEAAANGHELYSDAYHVGIVASVTAGQVTCIDGNYGNFPAPVARRQHHMDYIYGYARPPFDNTSTIGRASRIVPWPGRYLTLTSPHTEGADVLLWQQEMIDKSYTLGSSGPSGKGDDGIFGPKSYTAAKEYQSRNGLKDDGVIGPDTWNSLFNLSQ